MPHCRVHFILASYSICKLDVRVMVENASTHVTGRAVGVANLVATSLSQE